MITEDKKGNILQHKEIPGIQIQSPLVFAASDANFYLYFCVNGNLYSFDSDTKTNLELPSPSMTASRVSCIAISPQHTLAAAGYENGSVSIFDITSNKHLKNISKIGKNKITKCIFIGDSSLVVTDSSLNLIYISINFGLFGINIKEHQLTTFNTFPSKLISPPCYKYVNDSISTQKVTNQSHCISPSFSQIIGISLFNKVIIASVSTSNYEVIAEYEAEKPVLSLSLPNPDTLYVAFASMNKITVYSIDNNYKSEMIHTQSLKASPQFISFLSPSIIALIYEDFSVSLFSFLLSIEDSAKIELRGLFMSDNDSLKIMTPKTVFSVYLLTFFDQIDQFRKKGDFLSALSFCKKAYKNEPDAIVGLPSSIEQRSLIIEQSLSSFLELSVKERLKKGESPEKVTDDIINISKELNMQEWIIKEAPKLYPKRNQALKTFVNKVVQSDPDADFFNYNTKFVELVIENCSDSDISHFLNALPSKVVKNQVLLQYALDHDDKQLAIEVYLKRLHDPIGALNIYESMNAEKQIYEILNNYEDLDSNQRISSSLIKWIYSLRKNEENQIEFPRFENILKLPIEQSYSILQKIVDSEKPFSNDSFINSTLKSFVNVKIDHESDLFKIIEDFILNNSFSVLSASSMKFLFSSIFVEKFENPDKRESLLLRILDVLQPEKLQTEFVLSLLPLCHSFEFKKSRQWINQNYHLYGNILQEIIDDEIDDPFDWILKNMNSKSSDQILKTIQKNASYLVAKNSEKLILSLNNNNKTHENNELLIEILNCIKEKELKFYYIHNLIKLNLIDILLNKIDNENDCDFRSLLIDSIQFLCKYFPEDVAPLLLKHSDQLQMENDIIKKELISSCDSNDLSDCCALICMKTNDREKVLKYLRELIVKDVIKYQKLIFLIIEFVFNSSEIEEEEGIDDEEEEEEEDEAKSEVVSINSIQSLFFFIAKSFVAPMTECNQDEIDEIASIYRQICEMIFNSSLNTKTKNKLKLENIVNYSHSLYLRIGGEKFPRILRVLIYGQKFDSKQVFSIKNVLVNALQRDDDLSQLTCTKCKLGLFRDDTGIIILNCGHAIHDSKFCTKVLEEGCPACK